MADRKILRSPGDFLLGLAVGIILIVGLKVFYTDTGKTFRDDPSVFGNPLMGYAPEAYSGSVPEDVHLLYVNLSWREWEPEEGVFDIEGIKDTYQFDRWRAEGKHIVLRFICDYPEDDYHLDIPDWLDQKIGHDGTEYDTSYGKGFSPNYENPVLISSHEKTVLALGKAFGNDGFISYIELGSIGHWGEWHVKFSEGIRRLPGPEIRELYIKPWIDAFPNASILMRRPFAAAKEHGFGLYNDMTGHKEDTEEWLSWIRNGGKYTQTTDPADLLVPIPDFWKNAPVGGELTSSIGTDVMLGTNIEQTLKLIDESHMTFLGPKTAPEADEAGYKTVLGHLGYRLRIRSAKLSGKTLTMIWENSGAAPFYAEWPVEAVVFDKNNNIIERETVDICLPKLMPGEQKTVSIKLQPDLTNDGISIGVGIIDPMTGKAAVRLAMESIRREGWAILF